MENSLPQILTEIKSKKVIIHIDGDAFFASVSQAMDYKLQGKAVVTGGERYIAAAMSYEAKRRGVTRGMRLSEIKRVCPEAIILDSDYETYTIFARRMYDIVRGFTPIVEEYSIDECFADLSGLDVIYGISYEELGKKIKDELERKLGITFGVGISYTKVLAKTASKQNKPAGYTIIGSNRQEILQNLAIEKVWGIGSATTMLLRKNNILTAGDFCALSQNELYALGIAKPYREIHAELCGNSVLQVNSSVGQKPKSVMSSRSFATIDPDPDLVFSYLSKNIEEALLRLRHDGLCAKNCSVYVKSQDFRYYRLEFNFDKATNSPLTVLSIIKKNFPSLIKSHLRYRTTGVTFYNLVDESFVQTKHIGLFDELPEYQIDTPQNQSYGQREGVLFNNIDAVNKKYGEHTVMCASSFFAIKKFEHAYRHRKKQWEIPLIGKVRCLNSLGGTELVAGAE